MSRKSPPYGAALAARLQFNNQPFTVGVCVGADSWTVAKRINAGGQSSALVLPAGEKPMAFSWHLLRGQDVLIHWSQGPAKELIADLARAIAVCDPRRIIVYPAFVDFSAPAVRYDESLPTGKRWVACRESIQVFGARHMDAAAA